MVDDWRQALSRCQSCPRRCRIDRLAGERGICGLGALPVVAHAGLHFGEEPPISGSRGSGTIFFAGCPLRCLFCQNHQISQAPSLANWPETTVSELADLMLRLADEGAHNINCVSPSHVVWPLAQALCLARERGLSLPVVYNSSGYEAPEALAAMSGLVDIYLPDLKYLDGRLAGRYSGAHDYPEVATAAIALMLKQVGHLRMDEEGIARRGLIVRHLVLPGALDNSRRCLDWLASLAPEVTISLMSQYTPQHLAAQEPALNRRLSAAEYEAITDHALDLGLDHVFVQDMDSQDTLLPDFNQDAPFSPRG
ncbi:MAG: radical SAM protein [Desulfobacteraceae bacterium]|nr:radical SAM protein [Desulfobacteraceae bacterium]